MPEYQQVSLLVAFGGGVISFLSPCVLPMIPAYIGFITGSSLTDIEETSSAKFRALALYRSLGFVFGFTVVFVALGATASLLGRFLAPFRPLLRNIGGIVVFLFGLHLTGLLPIKWLYYDKRLEINPGSRSFLSATLMGVAFGAGWSPCVGPILSVILLYAGTSGTVGQGMQLLAAYSLGLGVPFLATALAIGWFTALLKRFSRYLPYVTIFSGALLMVMGILIFTNKLGWLNRYFYFIGNLEQLILK
jgi:cytochrome c-type biogenesis protein